ncbi:hypothetical protein FACS1894125_3010 [Actinomycetota bacterium]|nr:hypothetical protein FACS1894125_3010 [Actinomycetota bacterium]
MILVFCMIQKCGDLKVFPLTLDKFEKVCYTLLYRVVYLSILAQIILCSKSSNKENKYEEKTHKT